MDDKPAANPESPETALEVGQEIKVKVLNVDLETRKIGLSMKGV
jgi:ribosomal protein S1